MMGVLEARAVGAASGLLLALIANLVFLPIVLRDLSENYSDKYRAPVIGWNKQQLATAAKFTYRITMPVLFAFVGSIFAIAFFGVVE